MKLVRKCFTSLTVLLLLISCNALSMSKQKIAGWARIAGDCILGKVPVRQLSSPQQQTVDFPFTSLLPELQTLIITLISNGVNAKSLREAAQSISSLAQVNEELNTMINDPDFTLQLMKNLSERFKSANFDVCKELQTKQVRHQCDLQKQLFDLCIQESPNAHLFALLCNQNVDLRFTYNYKNHFASPLMLTCLTNSNLSQQILAADANNTKGLINQTTPSGMTALMICAQTPNEFAMRQLIGSSYIDVNKKDLQGNTALMYAINSTIDSTKKVRYVRGLLAKGADPKLPNAAGITPFEAAQKSADSQIRDILYEAVNKK